MIHKVGQSDLIGNVAGGLIYYSSLRITLLTAHDVSLAMVKILCIAEEKVSGCGLCDAEANLPRDHLGRVSVRATAILLRCERSIEDRAIYDCQSSVNSKRGRAEESTSK